MNWKQSVKQLADGSVNPRDIKMKLRSPLQPNNMGKMVHNAARMLLLI